MSIKSNQVPEIYHVTYLLCLIKRAMARPIFLLCSRKISRHISNNSHAVSESLNGQLRSTMMSLFGDDFQSLPSDLRTAMKLSSKSRRSASGPSCAKSYSRCLVLPLDRAPSLAGVGARFACTMAWVFLLEIGEMVRVISAFIGLIGLGPASRVLTFHLLDSLLTTTTKIPICPI